MNLRIPCCQAARSLRSWRRGRRSRCRCSSPRASASRSTPAATATSAARAATPTEHAPLGHDPGNAQRAHQQTSSDGETLDLRHLGCNASQEQVESEAVSAVSPSTSPGVECESVVLSRALVVVRTFTACGDGTRQTASAWPARACRHHVQTVGITTTSACVLTAQLVDNSIDSAYHCNITPCSVPIADKVACTHCARTVVSKNLDTYDYLNHLNHSRTWRRTEIS